MAPRASGVTRRIPVENEHGEPTGWVVFDPFNDHVKVAGGVYIPAEYRLRFPGDGDQPALTVLFTANGGVPVCTGVELESAPGGRRVQPKDLKTVADKLAQWTESAYRIVAQYGEETATGARFGGDVDGRTATRAAATARRRATAEEKDAKLREIAALYRDNIDTGVYAAIMDRFGCAEPTAARYVGEARKAGYIPQTKPGRRKKK